MFWNTSSGPHPSHVHGAGHQIRPGLDILPGIIDHRGLARGPGRGVEAYQLVHGHGEHVFAPGPEVVLGGEGDLADIVQGAEPARRHPGLGQTLPVKRAFGRPGHRLLEAGQLQLLKLGGRFGFKGRIPIHGFFLLNFWINFGESTLSPFPCQGAGFSGHSPGQRR